MIVYARQIYQEETYSQRERKIEAKKNIALKKRVGNITIGILSLAVCALSPVLFDGDATIWFVMVPAAIYNFSKARS